MRADGDGGDGDGDGDGGDGCGGARPEEPQWRELFGAEIQWHGGVTLFHPFNIADCTEGRASLRCRDRILAEDGRCVGPNTVVVFQAGWLP